MEETSQVCVLKNVLTILKGHMCFDNFFFCADLCFVCDFLPDTYCNV